MEGYGRRPILFLKVFLTTNIFVIICFVPMLVFPFFPDTFDFNVLRLTER